MASLNKVLILGNLGRDPEVRLTQSGQSVATFSVATSDRWTDKASGQPQERTEWHRIVVWGKQAEHCQKYLSKGRQVFIEGRLQTREWTNKEGQKQYTTEIVANQVTFVGGRGEGGGGGGDFPPAPSDNDMMGGSGGMSGGMGGGSPMGSDDDIPF